MAQVKKLEEIARPNQGGIEMSPHVQIFTWALYYCQSEQNLQHYNFGLECNYSVRFNF